MTCYAHSLSGHPPSEWQSLEEHSRNVGDLAASFAAPFGSSETARLLGMVHDAGKARPAFQAYLLRQNGIDVGFSDCGEHGHSGAGACWAAENLKGVGRFLAYPIAGHHAGLTDWNAMESSSVASGALSVRLENEHAILNEPEFRDWMSRNSQELSEFKFEKPWKDFATRDASFWLRMLYSCLVDADFLDTEQFMDGKRADIRGGFEQFPVIAGRFEKNLNKMRQAAKRSSVNEIRDRILDACESASMKASGLFSLTVPTGGGKTLSSTDFAFRHALANGMKRIIYVIPYTSIIEQTADVLRSFAGNENVLEHQCNLDPAKDDDRFRLAAENWDAPVIVTTAVQFFESLYACRSSRCRKLHNICNSVIILDEVQLLPPQLLLPIAEAIHQLSSHYGCSIVLSTATQTSLKELKPLESDSIHEIIPPDWNLYRELKRTEIELPKNLSQRNSWKEIAERLSSHEQVLCVVNTRRDCRYLFELMPEGTIHLSASMCGAHRSRVIAEIKRRLRDGESIRVISTQLIEAGVDVDFPIVYRAFTGLPSIVQTAGRCNREGKLAMGRVVVFMPPEPAPLGGLRWYEDAFESLLSAEPNLNLDSDAVFPEFYRRFYAAQHDLGGSFDDLLIRDAHRARFQFREAAEKFNMIDSNGTMSVIVRYADDDCDSESLIRTLKAIGPKRDVMRKLQRFTVTLPKWTFQRLLEYGAFTEAFCGSGVYVQEADSVYSEIYGLDLGWQGLTIDGTII